MAQKILIVDDNAPTRGALVKLLADAGFETMTATTVPEAMRALATTPPNLLITEIRLDSYNGLHLIVRSRNHLPLMATILTHDDADPVLLTEAATNDAAFLILPCEPALILKTVEECLNAARTSRNG